MAPVSETIAILDSDPDTTDLLKTVLEYGGFSVVTGNLADFRLGRANVGEFLTTTGAKVVIYDLGIPYEQNWAFLESLRRDPAFASRGIVITTTNQAAVQALLGVQAIEILGKPYDLERLIVAVWNALNGAPRVHGDDARTDRRRATDRRHGDRRSFERRRSPE